VSAVTQEQHGPLSGLRVVELAGIGPGPYACLLLAELGAEVIRVDRPAGGPVVAPADTLTRSRRTIAVDLKAAEGRAVVLRLLETADVLVEGLRPGVTERLGLGPEVVHDRNPRLVYARMTGWGQDGPWARTAGHDINYASLTGALHVTGGPDKPVQAANLVADFGGGSLFLLTGVLAALHERQSSGLGQVVDAAMVDGAASLMTMVYGMHADGTWLDRRSSNLLDGGVPYYDTYRCADGKHVSVGCLEPQFYRVFTDILRTEAGVELDGGQEDEQHWPAHRAAFEAAFASRTRDEWAAVFDGTDACVAPVLSLEEAPHHPHMAARGIFDEARKGHEPRVAPRFSRTPGRTPVDPRPAGSDTVATLRGAGFSDDEIEALVSAGVVQQAPAAAVEQE
jgi:alpha-methylacyl-CoA racemase